MVVRVLKCCRRLGRLHLGRSHDGGSGRKNDGHSSSGPRAMGADLLSPSDIANSGDDGAAAAAHGMHKASPLWYMVDIAFVEQFADTVPLATLKGTKGLDRMMVTQKGSRLSVQPVTKTEYDIVVRLGRRQ